MKKYQKVLFLLFIAAIFFIIYWTATNQITTKKLYPWSPTWFRFDVAQLYAPKECFVIYLRSLHLDLENNILTTQIGFEKKCDFDHVPISFAVSNIKCVTIANEKNLTMNINMLNNSTYDMKILINSSNMELGNYYPVDINFYLVEGFYNFFDFFARGTYIELMRINFDTSFGFNGLSCDGEECLTVIEGDIKKEEPIWRGFSKKIRFEKNNERILIRFSPKSQFWVASLKILEIFILGISAVLIYEIFNLLFIKDIIEEKEKYPSKKSKTKDKAWLSSISFNKITPYKRYK
ncbi:hypothetical protein HY636_00430 [Candidatus Woesearchaeota archaeon]|nr:hypothetical protein [Candidatus Woesearchaeota archaeon]